MTEVNNPRDRLVIVSGGQTGADRAALDWALRHGLDCGGWCPLGRRAEDGVIASRYPLAETPSRDYRQRTRWNVRDSDATVIFSLMPDLEGGSRLTRALASQRGKPWLHLHPGLNAVALLGAFVHVHRPRVLNVAGPRASKAPGIDAFVCAVLEQTFYREPAPAR